MKRRRSLGRSSASFTRYPIIALLLGSVPAVALDDSALRSLTRADGIIPVVAPGGRAAMLDNSIAKLDAPGGFLSAPPASGAITGSGPTGCRLPDGRCTWEQTFGGPLEDKLYGLTATEDDGVLAVGNSRSFGTAAYDGVALRLNREGRIVWMKRLGGRDADQVYAVDQDTEGGFVVAGHTRSKGKGKAMSGSFAWIQTARSPGTALSAVRERIARVA